MLLELVLTLGLAGIIYLEGEVSSKLAVIKGNKLYSKALERLAGQSLTWFSSHFSVKLADKFNHVPYTLKIGLRKDIHSLAQLSSYLQKLSNPNSNNLLRNLKQKERPNNNLSNRYNLSFNALSFTSSRDSCGITLLRIQILICT